MFVDPSGLCYFDINGKWRHDNWEYSYGYKRKADPRSSFFTATPKYDTTNWNSNEYISNTNCYSYAFNMLVNPLTGKKFPRGGMQPGMFSGTYDLKKIQSDEKAYLEYLQILSGTTDGNIKLVNRIIADMTKVGIEFIPYEEGLTGGYRVALVVGPNIPDYHWYRDNGDGTWSHKPGQSDATNKEVLGVDANGTIIYGDIITDPEDAAKKAGYEVFVGYYYVRPLGG